MAFTRDSSSTVPDPKWQSPPVGWRLEPTEVHVWRAALNPPADDVERLFCLLSPDERSRAERFHFEHDRRRFIVARSILRLILSQYLMVEPNRVRFRYGAQGKPFLASEFERNALQFNLSHAEELALYAFNFDRAIGIDIEYLKPETDITAIAGRFFSPSESATLLMLPETQRLEAFFRCWTRKEAYIKAKGAGFSLPLDQFDVSFVGDQPTRLLKTRNDPEEANRWSLQALTPAPYYTGAVAVEGHHWVLKCWQWVESCFQ